MPPPAGASRRPRLMSSRTRVPGVPWFSPGAGGSREASGAVEPLVGVVMVQALSLSWPSTYTCRYGGAGSAVV
jgi:hypothetical protein